MNEQHSSGSTMVDSGMRALMRSIPLFADLSDADLDGLAGKCRIRDVLCGETLVESGARATSLFVVIEGELEVLRSTNGQLIPIGIRGRGDVVGEMALLTDGPRTATLRARSDTQVLEIQQQPFRSWLAGHPASALFMLGTVISRLQSAEAHLVQQQHLTALGTLAAGLAHELNNPAAALLRSSGQLDKAVLAWGRLSSELGALAADASGQAQIDELRQVMGDRAGSVVSLGPLARSDREGEIQRWLEKRQVAGSWRLAPMLVDNGWALEGLRELAADIPPERLALSLEWLATGGTVNRLLQELRMSAQVISDLVAAVKSYSRLDEAPLQNVDLHAGLDQALVILHHKLKGIDVVREYATPLPMLVAHPTELNQLWANLIGNAADALAGHGQIVVRTGIEDAWAVVDIEDDGPGIPPGIQPRLFEPFFTTKAPGKGTGLGLAISHSIVQKHRGSIEVESEPGRTRFRVRLPLRSGLR